MTRGVTPYQGFWLHNKNLTTLILMNGLILIMGKQKSGTETVVRSYITQIRQIMHEWSFKKFKCTPEIKK